MNEASVWFSTSYPRVRSWPISVSTSRAAARRVCFALVEEFKKDLLDTQVRQSGGILNNSLREALLAVPSQLTLSIP